MLTEIRHRGDTPAIMLTSLDREIGTLTELRIGADDYVLKPFNPAEVAARVMAVLSRTKAASQDNKMLTTLMRSPRRV